MLRILQDSENLCSDLERFPLLWKDSLSDQLDILSNYLAGSSRRIFLPPLPSPPLFLS